ncbi:MAG: Holliday junction branch migration protein RuvA [Bacteroidetes bacterium]|nr:Holliday junction branch migration protein RuvA [Bacteroidota bacterium]
MYSFIEGRIAELNPAIVVIDCQGIGYMINISLNTYSKIVGKESCRIHTHLVVREDAMILYGFADDHERVVFQQLISVSGVGPNTARLILSSLGPNEVVDAIVHENVKALQSIKGIGGKSALRLIVDLKDKMQKDTPVREILGSGHNTAKAEALSALVMLGFNKTMAEKAIEQVFKVEGLDLPVEHLVKSSLKIL